MQEMMLVEAYSIVLIFALVFLIQGTKAIVKTLISVDKPTQEEAELLEVVTEKKKEAEKNNFPATFMKWAELSREANKLEIKLEDLKAKRVIEMNKPWRKRLDRFLKYLDYGFLAAIYLSTYLLSDEEFGLMQFQPGTLTPLSRFLPIGLQNNSDFLGLGPLCWAAVCQRVLKRFF